MHFLVIICSIKVLNDVHLHISYRNMSDIRHPQQAKPDLVTVFQYSFKQLLSNTVSPKSGRESNITQGNTKMFSVSTRMSDLECHNHLIFWSDCSPKNLRYIYE